MLRAHDVLALIENRVLKYKEFRAPVQVMIPFVILYWVGIAWESLARGGSQALYFVNKIPTTFWFSASSLIVVLFILGLVWPRDNLVRCALSVAFFISSFRSMLIAMSFIRTWGLISKAAIPAVMLITTLHWVLARTSLKEPPHVGGHFLHE